VLVGVVTDNLNRVLVGAYCTVGSQTVELSLEHSFAAQCDFFFLRKRSESNVVHNTDSEVVLRHRHSQVLVNCDDLCRSGILGTQTVTAAYDNRSVFRAVEAVFYIEVQRFAVSTRFLRTVEYGNLLGSFGNGSQEVLGRERTIQVNGNQTNLFAVGNEVVDGFTGSFRYRTHSDDYAFCIFCTVVIEQTVLAACDFGNLVHVFLYDSGNSFVVVVAGFAVLEEVVGVFGHTAGNRVHRVQCTCTEFSQCFLVDKRSEVFVLQHFNLLDFVRSTETVEEVNERYAALDSRKVSDTRQVHNFLYRTFGQHGETSLTCRHYVLVVTEDTQRMACQSTCGYVEHARQEFTGNLVHVRYHQQQTL